MTEKKPDPLEFGGVAIRTLDLPDWLTEQTERQAIEIIQQWEEDHESESELIARLIPLLVTDKPHYCAPGECRKFATWPPKFTAEISHRRFGKTAKLAQLSRRDVTSAELAEAEFYLAQRDK